MGIQSETELYAPVKNFLERQGFSVRGEVNHCDLVAIRGEEILVVELKRTFNLSLVLQGIDRQTIATHVYLAIEKPKRKRNAIKWSDVLHLCRRLGLGLLTVVFERRGAAVEVALDPLAVQIRKSKVMQSQLVKEFSSRQGDYNVGGSKSIPIVTAYRQNALRVADRLRELGPSKVKALRDSSGVPNTGQLLSKNYYGWFQRVSHGIYRLTTKGEEALLEFADVVHDFKW